MAASSSLNGVSKPVRPTAGNCKVSCNVIIGACSSGEGTNPRNRPRGGWNMDAMIVLPGIDNSLEKGAYLSKSAHQGAPVTPQQKVHEVLGLPMVGGLVCNQMPLHAERYFLHETDLDMPPVGVMTLLTQFG